MNDNAPLRSAGLGTAREVGGRAAGRSARQNEVPCGQGTVRVRLCCFLLTDREKR